MNDESEPLNDVLCMQPRGETLQQALILFIYFFKNRPEVQVDCGRSVKTCSCTQPLPGRAGRACVSAARPLASSPDSLASQVGDTLADQQQKTAVYSDETGVGVELNVFPIRTTVIAG